MNRAVISLVDPENAPEDIRKVAEAHMAKGYRMTNEKRTLLHNAVAFEALEGMSYAVSAEMKKFTGHRAANLFQYTISLLEGEVGDYDPADARLTAARHKALGVIRENDVRIGHKYERYLHITSQLCHKIEYLIRRDSAGKGADIRCLNDGTLCCRVREGNTELDEVSALCCHFAYYPPCCFKVRVTAGYEWDKSLSAAESICNITHIYPPLCSVR